MLALSMPHACLIDATLLLLSLRHTLHFAMLAADATLAVCYGHGYAFFTMPLFAAYD